MKQCCSCCRCYHGRQTFWVGFWAVGLGAGTINLRTVCERTGADARRKTVRESVSHTYATRVAAVRRRGRGRRDGYRSAPTARPIDAVAILSVSDRARGGGRRSTVSYGNYRTRGGGPKLSVRILDTPKFVNVLRNIRVTYQRSAQGTYPTHVQRYGYCNLYTVYFT